MYNKQKLNRRHKLSIFSTVIIQYTYMCDFLLLLHPPKFHKIREKEIN